MEAIRDGLQTALQVEERQRAARFTQLVREANLTSARHPVAAQVGRVLVRVGTRLEAMAGRPAPSAFGGTVDPWCGCAN
jgi:hypothetical protein